RAPSSLLTTNGTTATQLYTLSLHDALPIYARKRARDAFDGGIAAVDQELRRRAAGEQVRLEVRRNPDADVDLAAAQRFFERARAAHVTLDAHHLRRFRPAQQFARGMALRLVGRRGTQVTHVEIDGIAEEKYLQQRHTDDHAERKTITRQLLQLLAGNRDDPTPRVHWRRSAPKPVAATNTSSRFASTRKTRPSRPASLSQSRATCSGEAMPRSSRACRRVPSCATLFTPARRSSARRAARGSAVSISSTVASMFAASSRGTPSATRRPRSRMARRWQRSASSM